MFVALARPTLAQSDQPSKKQGGQPTLQLSPGNLAVGG